MPWLLLIILIPYLYHLLKIYLSLNQIKPYLPVKYPDVFVSVIVACRNEEGDLLVLLNNISDQDYNPDLFELVITDDNSTDRTFAVASEFRKIRNIKVIRNNGTGKKQAIRTGVQASSGNLIITTDADCRMEQTWIRTIASCYSDNKPEMIIGPVRLESKPGFFSRFQELEFLSLQGVTAGTAARGNPVMCNGANLVFSKESYNRHSADLHYDLISGDDVFLLHALKKEYENKILWLESESSVVTTKTSETIGSFLRQRSRWISKAGAYKDVYTIVISIVTFVTVLLQIITLVAGFFKPVFLLVFAGSFLLKSIPDFLILQNTTLRYNRQNLMKWFIPAQFIYPFYVLAVIFRSVLLEPNFPSPKGT
jgi:glycosyltransferase involved in cell wall biosynthesis